MLPLTWVPPIKTESPEHSEVSFLTTATGKGKTVIFTESEFVQPVEVSTPTTVYVIFVFGKAIMLSPVVSVKKVLGLQIKSLPLKRIKPKNHLNKYFDHCRQRLEAMIKQ